MSRLSPNKAGTLKVPDAILQTARLREEGRLAEAQALCQSILDSQPDQVDALHLLAILQLQRGMAAAAMESVSRALEHDPQSVAAHVTRGEVFIALGRYQEAIASYDRALVIDPGQADAHLKRGIALADLTRYREALASYDRALRVRPDHASVHYHRAHALARLNRHHDALAGYDRVLAIKATHVGAHYHRGRTLQLLNRHAEAASSYDQALKLRPDDPDVLNSLGNTLQSLGRHAKAVAAYDRALAVKPRFPQALYNRGNALQALSRHQDASASYERVLVIDPHYNYAEGAAAFSRAHLCDWSAHGEKRHRLIEGVKAGKSVTTPFPFLAFSGDPADHLACARKFIRDKHPSQQPALWRGERYHHARIRIAYLSADYHEHATAYLMAELFERHDRDRFEVTAISYGPATRDGMRKRLIQAFDHFIDIRGKSDADAARRLRDAETDIAVDLKGFTTDSRPGILAYRPAPIQVNYLGYPGSMAADYIDYILADPVVIPAEHQRFYAERVVYLPHSYQANDATREISGHSPTRAEAGLPGNGLVFCCFNSSYKITPEIFNVWMGLLRRIEGSVFWLLECSEVASRNLRHEAAARGVAPERLVFAPRTRLPDHLARHRLADLFLDTLPVNAHTTASDALWSGLPVVTCCGTTFAGRVAASLLTATGLPELITHSIDEYEALALKLGTDAALLGTIRKKLATNRLTTPLFDADRFRRNIETAYTAMRDIHERGEQPAAISV